MPRQTPEILCHMATTIDGHLAPRRWPFPESEVLKLYERTAERLRPDGWIVGRATMAEFLPEAAPTAGQPCGPRADHVGEANGRRIAICFDRMGRIQPRSEDLEGDHLVIVLTPQAPAEHVEALILMGVSVFVTEPGAEGLRDVLGRIGAAFGAGRLLLEGGGTLNGSFLAAGLIDAVSTLVLPIIDGRGGRPAIYGHDTDAPPVTLTLATTEVLEGGAVWIRHDVVRETVA